MQAPTVMSGIVQKLTENGPAVILAAGAFYLIFRQYSAGVNRIFDFLSGQVLTVLQGIKADLEELKRK